MMIVLVLMLVAAGVLLVRLYPPLGARATGDRQLAMKGSANYSQRRFLNLIPTVMNTSLRGMLSVAAELARGGQNRRPRRALSTLELNPADLQNTAHTKVIWFGHSSLLLQLNGRTLLLDPMYGPAPSPFPFIGGKRYSRTPPVDVDSLPDVDAVILSHDHYDHLDYGSIRRLNRKVSRFFVPLGVGAHLERWGVPREKITEADWWDELEFAGLKLACTPSRHFSGRSLTDRNATLWCSWVIDGGSEKIYFSGDSGYGPHFRQIGERYGPFDLTLMECGQYNEQWAAIHMMPEETVQAHLDVGGKVLLPIHWGAFTLSVHAWTEPIERAVAAAQKNNVTVATPRIGEPVILGKGSYPGAPWWQEG
ncbi:MAG: hypothetical protein K0R57_288 [Paenibacillaceae bacterium]|jgi:L-ascorbate metabolism protein UlaG (beta-lactamase superfamily)|nr:hypothetical protein [Paenibacillaceae bacterium]